MCVRERVRERECVREREEDTERGWHSDIVYITRERKSVQCYSYTTQLEQNLSVLPGCVASLVITCIHTPHRHTTQLKT